MVARNFRASMFNRQASDPKNKPDEILKILDLQKGQTVADIGSGGGYFCLRFAEAVGEEGKVYAVDMNAQFLEFIGRVAKEKGLGNIETVLVSNGDPVLPEKGLDLIFLRNVYHHLPNRVSYFEKLRSKLKPEGRVAVVEYKRGKRFTFHGMFGHSVQKELIIEEMNKAGYRTLQELDFLSAQSFTIFSV